MSKASPGRICSISLLVLCLASAFLALCGLGNAAFWDDEAHTAFFARNLAQTGQLTGWDGRNLYAYRNGRLLDAELKTINPPLEYLVTALSFKIFGVSTRTARLPFALCGLLCLPVLFWSVRHEFQSPRLALLSVLLLGVSIPFLLFLRQCRYYALAVLFSLLLWGCWRRFVQTRRDFYLWGAAAAGIALYFANYLIAGAFFVALAALCFLKRSPKSQNAVFRFPWPLLLAFCVIAAHAVQKQIWLRPDNASADPWLSRHLLLLGLNLRDLNDGGLWPWPFLAVLPLVFWKCEAGQRKIAARWLGFAALYFGCIVVLSPQPTDERNTTILHADVRYLLPLLPVAAVLTAFALRELARRSRPLAGAILLVVLLSNAAILSPTNRNFRFWWPDYLREITHPYPTSTAAVVEFLDKNAPSDATVYAAPTYMNYPMMFYLSDKIRFAALLNRQSPLAPSVLAPLKAPLFEEENFPQYVIGFGIQDELLQKLQFFSRRHLEAERAAFYPYKAVANLPIYFGQTQRPELWNHTFGPRALADAQAESVYVFQRGPVSR